MHQYIKLFFLSVVMHGKITKEGMRLTGDFYLSDLERGT
jgi:hypothetical protein